MPRPAPFAHQIRILPRPITHARTGQRAVSDQVRGRQGDLNLGKTGPPQAVRRLVEMMTNFNQAIVKSVTQRHERIFGSYSDEPQTHETQARIIGLAIPDHPQFTADCAMREIAGNIE
ncbi:MAG TPA: hypothetical protein VF447_03660 [Terriglobales bacterium]